MGGETSLRKRLGNPASEPHDHLNIKHRLTFRAKRLSGHAITHFKVLILYRSPFAGEPKKMFSRVTCPPIYQYNSDYSMSTARHISVFITGKRASS